MDISIYKLKTKFQNLLMPICEKLVKLKITPNQITVTTVLLNIIFAGIIYKFSNYNFSNPNTLILLKTKSGRHALAYYQKGKLTMASFVSIGTAEHKTISGQYTITPDQIRRRSRKYKNAPMPYSLHIS